MLSDYSRGNFEVREGEDGNNCGKHKHESKPMNLIREGENGNEQ